MKYIIYEKHFNFLNGLRLKIAALFLMCIPTPATSRSQRVLWAISPFIFLWSINSLLDFFLS